MTAGSDDLWRYLREPNKGPAPAEFVPEPEAVRLRAILAAWERHRDSFLGPDLLRGAIRAEIRLADLEGRSPRDFAIEQQTKPSPAPLHQPPPKKPEPPTIEGEFNLVDESRSNSDSVAGDGAEEPPPRAGNELEW